MVYQLFRRSSHYLQLDKNLGLSVFKIEMF